MVIVYVVPCWRGWLRLSFLCCCIPGFVYRKRGVWS